MITSQLGGPTQAKFPPHETTYSTRLPPLLETQKLSQNLMAINDAKFPDAVTKSAIHVIILKALLCALLHNMF
jgi:hypothetical protein